jgi:hypothetical protein
METANKPYFEADYEQVVLCRKFMRDVENIDKRSVYNPFTCRVIKKGSSTYVLVYNQVKSYLEKLDDEEFHSPIKNVELVVTKVEGVKCMELDHHLEKSLVCNISDSFMDKVKLNLKKYISQKVQDEKSLKTNSFYSWRYDYFNNCADENYEILVNKWIQSNPELYSFIDYYKPEVLNNSYLMKHLITYDEPAKYFINYIQNCCNIFIHKIYEYGISTPKVEKRYPCGIIMLWIYKDFINESIKFLKKNCKKLSEYLESKPKTEVRLSVSAIKSIVFAWFLLHTGPDKLENVKTKYDEHFNKLLREMFLWSDRERIYAKTYYRHLFLNFMANRVKPFRYIDINYKVFSEFDQLIQFISNPIPVDDDTDQENDIEDNGKEEV